MCGRYSFFDTDRLYERFEVDKENAIQLADHYNVAPGQVMPVIVNDGVKKIELKRWGLIPYWAKEAKIGYNLINARAETVAQKASFKKPLISQRCLVPASGYFEWQKLPGYKQPYFFHKKDSSLFGFAGLYDKWRNPDTNEMVDSYTIITTEALDRFKNIHPRMPVILERNEEDDWLNSNNSDPGMLTKILAMSRMKMLVAEPISTAVNSPKNDSKDILKKIRN